MLFNTIITISLATAASAVVIPRAEEPSADCFNLQIISSNTQYHGKYISTQLVSGSDIWIAGLNSAPYPHFTYIAQNGQLNVNDKYTASWSSSIRVGQHAEPLYFVPDIDGPIGFETDVSIDWATGANTDMDENNGPIGGNMTDAGAQNWYICKDTRPITWPSTSMLTGLSAINIVRGGNPFDSNCEKIGIAKA